MLTVTGCQGGSHFANQFQCQITRGTLEFADPFRLKRRPNWPLRVLVKAAGSRISVRWLSASSATLQLYLVLSVKLLLMVLLRFAASSRSRSAPPLGRSVLLTSTTFKSQSLYEGSPRPRRGMLGI